MITVRREGAAFAIPAALAGLALTLLSASALGQPANDDCADAIAIGEGTVSGTTTGATNDANSTCGQSNSSPDVWYVFTATEDGFLEVTTCGLNAYDTVLGVWTGCPGSGIEISCNDDSCFPQSTVTTPMSEGQDYYIRVSGFNNASGPFSLSVSGMPGGKGDGPDVIYSDCTGITNWGEIGGIRAYSLGSHTCNIGDTNLDWGGNTPLLAMNAFRLRNGRLEQIGQSWVKNGTTAAAGSGCGLPCNGQGGPVLGAGCLDVYSSGFNGSHGILGPRSNVNAFTGVYPGASGGGGNAIYKRLQIRETELQSAGALYFIEGQYVAWDDAAFGNALNNASYKRVTVSGGSLDLNVTGSMNVGDPAIYAWRDHGNGVNNPDLDVEIVEVDVPDEGRFHVAAKVTPIEGGGWHYEYAVRNLNSHRSAGSFSVPLPGGESVVVENVGFRDVDYHSGEPYDGTDWVGVAGARNLSWSTNQSFDEDPDANALRFGTMYNFWFDANVPPVAAQATIGLFRPGGPDSVSFDLTVPDPGAPCPGDLDGDGEIEVDDLVEMILAWGPCPGGCAADLTGDDEVDVDDLVELVLSWGPCP